MEIKILKHNDIGSLEFEILRELPKLRVLTSLITDEQEYEKQNFFSSIENNLKKIIEFDKIFEVIHKIDEGFICKCNNRVNPYLFIRDYSNMEVGEIYIYKSNGYRNEKYITKLNEEFIDEKKVCDFFEVMDTWVDEGEKDQWGRNSRRYSPYLIDSKEIDGKELNFKVVTEAFEEHKISTTKKEKEQIERETIKEKEEKEKENEEKLIYDSECRGNFNDMMILDKVIKRGGIEYVLSKKVNKTFSYEVISSKEFIGYYNDTILSGVEISLNNRKISYTKKIDKDKEYIVTYVNDKCKINGVKIPTVKVKFILNRIYIKGGTEDEIKMLVKLNGMKVDFISLEEIDWRDGDDIKIPISNKAIDDKTFEIDFLNHKKTFDWEEVKDIFFNGGNCRVVDRYFYNKDLSQFCEKMGIEKSELFKTLRRIKMINNLKTDEDVNGS